MVNQKEIRLLPCKRGFHLITHEVERNISPLPESGILHLFIKHTSAGLAINENCDPDVLIDFNGVFDQLVPENIPFLQHIVEGPDDMPAHIKSVLTGHNISIPITNHRLNLGVWQGIYLCEFRNHASSRILIATIMS